MTVEVRRGSDRFLTRDAGRHTRHSFSFGQHYDPDNLAFGPLVCHDDHLLAPGAGFDDHSHTDVEIVTWVVRGALVHRGPDGEHRLHPGDVQVQSAGSGLRHAETAAPDAGPTRFVQAWLRPDQPGSPPATSRGTPTRRPGVLVPVAGEGSDLPVGVAGATLAVADLAAGDEVTLSEARLRHAFVATGALARSSLAQPLEAGDAFRIDDHPGPVHLTAAAPTTLLVWAFR